MGTKKKGASSFEEMIINEGDELKEVDGVKDLKKKRKRGKKNKVDTDGGDDASSSLVPSSVKPMERRKKRKMLDKERHRVASESKETEPKQLSGVVKPEDHETTSSIDGLPAFHIGVFSDLASSDVSKREAAAERLAVELWEVQKVYDKVGSKVNHGGFQLEAEKDDGLDDCAPSVRYAVRRLIRGVSSSRECARQGFALGLTALISTNSKIRTDSVLKLIVDLLEVSSSMKGQEAKDCLLGRLFAYGALTRSGRLREEWTSDKNTPHVRDFTSQLISLASKRQYLRDPAVAVLLNLIEMLPKEAVLKHFLEAPGLHDWFEGATNPGNPDALLLALKTREQIGSDSAVFGKLLPFPFSPNRFFTADHLTSISSCLKESSFCQPRVHGIWPYLINILLPDSILQDYNAVSNLNSTKKHKKGRKSGSSYEDVTESLKCFCEVILEESILKSSHDRKHLAFDVLLLMLPRLPASCVPIVLSHKFVQCLMDILKTKESWLHKVAVHFLKELSDWVGSDDIRRVFVVVALQKHSGGRFDSITRTKTTKDLMSGFTTESGAMLFIQKLTSMFVDEDHTSDEPSDQSQTTDDNDNDNDNSEMGSAEEKESSVRSVNTGLKSWVVESLPNVLKYLELDNEAKFRVQKEVMKFLAVQGLFSASLGTEVTSFELQEKFRWPKAPISSALCKMCIEQLQFLLSNAEKSCGQKSGKQKSDGQKSDGPLLVSNSLETNDLGYYFMRFLGTLCTIPSVSLVRPLSNQDEQAFKKLQAMESRLSREEKNCGLSADAKKPHALRHLLIQLLLQLLLCPDEFAEAASELVICCRKAFSLHDLLGSSEEEESEDGESPVLMEVLVDTLLSLLPQSSAPLRSAVEQAFRYFSDRVTDDGLLRMLRVIKKDLKPARHKDGDVEDDGDDDLLGIEEADESDEDDVMETGETDDSKAVVEAEAADEEIHDTSDDDEDMDAQTDDSKAVVEAEAGDEEIHDASGDDDDDDDGDTDEDMDDDAMFKMDAYLKKIFQERKNQAGGDSAHAQLVLFKLRVLSLLEIYLSEYPGSSRVLIIYSNLVQAFVNPSTTEGSEQLAQRIWGILQKIFKAKDYPKGEDIQLITLESLLEKSLRLASRPFRKKRSAGNIPPKKHSFAWNRYKMINSLAQQSTYWILKIIDGRKFSKDELDRIFEIFKGALVNYLKNKKCQLKPDFFKEIFKRRPWVGQHLIETLLESCIEAKFDYRRVEALELIQEIFKSLHSENDPNPLKKLLKSSISKLSQLMKELVTHMPEKQARRAEVRKFCGKVFQIISTHHLSKSFVKTLEPDSHAVFESQLGDSFLALKKKLDKS